MTSETTPARPVAAATLLLLRDGEGGLEVLMMTRPANASFAAGALVFPGGGVDPVDRAAATHACCAPVATLEDDELAFRVAAIREAFEECGILLARRRGAAALLGGAEVAALRERLRQHGGAAPDLAALVAEGGLELAVDRLTPFAHWITPIDQPKRFDTRFYLAAMPEHQTAIHDGREALDAIWVSPGAAVAAGETGKASLIFATRANLLRLARSDSVAAALAAAAADPIVTVVPVVSRTEAGLVYRIPAEAGYGFTEAPAGQTRRP